MVSLAQEDVESGHGGHRHLNSRKELIPSHAACAGGLTTQHEGYPVGQELLDQTPGRVGLAVEAFTVGLVCEKGRPAAAVDHRRRVYLGIGHAMTSMDVQEAGDGIDLVVGPAPFSVAGTDLEDSPERMPLGHDEVRIVDLERHTTGQDPRPLLPKIGTGSALGREGGGEKEDASEERDGDIRSVHEGAGLE